MCRHVTLALRNRVIVKMFNYMCLRAIKIQGRNNWQHTYKHFFPVFLMIYDNFVAYIMLVRFVAHQVTIEHVTIYTTIRIHYFIGYYIAIFISFFLFIVFMDK